MKSLKPLVLLLLACVMTSSCIDEINLSMEESNQALVIDAWMGNIPGETYVKVYRTSPYKSGISNPSFINVPVDKVLIEEMDGQVIPFSQVEPTVFKQSWSFQPQPGKAYRLVVELPEGEVFESTWEVMPPLVTIEDLTPEGYEKQVMLSSGDEQFFQTRTFADIQAQITDPGLGEFGYLVETSGISELYTQSDSDNCACSCYEKEPNIFAGMNVTSHGNFLGRSFGISLGEIPLSSLGRFYISAKLRTVTKSNYDFLNQLDKQQRSSGSIFDPAPFRIKGNIKRRGAENELVLGGFFLFQESKFEKMLYRTEIRASALDLSHQLEPIPVVEASCDEYYKNASPNRPDPFRP